MLQALRGRRPCTGSHTADQLRCEPLSTALLSLPRRLQPSFGTVTTSAPSSSSLSSAPLGRLHLLDRLLDVVPAAAPMTSSVWREKRSSAPRCGCWKAVQRRWNPAAPRDAAAPGHMAVRATAQGRTEDSTDAAARRSQTCHAWRTTQERICWGVIFYCGWQGGITLSLCRAGDH